MPVKEKARRSHERPHSDKGAHHGNRKVKPEPHDIHEPEEVPHKNRLAHLVEDEEKAQPSKKKSLPLPGAPAGETDHTPMPDIQTAEEPTEVLEGDEVEQEPTAEELQAEEVTVQEVAGSV